MNHHPSCKESDKELIIRCGQCGEMESAESIVEKQLVDAKIEGVRLYAWWKDGVQYVGSCGNTLEDAIKRIMLGED